jgi:hypothetical protein
MAKKKKGAKKKSGDGGARTIAIDMEVHKRIEAARLSFEESDNAILRRLLRVGEAQPAGAPEPAAPPRRAKGGGAADGGWSKIGRHGRTVFLPDGTLLRAAYGGRTVEGEVRDGAWLVNGAAYNSPSAALIANVQTKDGSPVNLNGWRHWEVRRPGEEVWLRLSEL